jgi:hypothetical protein
MKELLEQTKSNQFAMWQGCYVSRDSVRIVVPVEYRKIIFRNFKANGRGRCCLTALQDKDIVLNVYGSKNLKMVAVKKFSASKKDFIDTNLFWGSEEKVLQDIRNFLGKEAYDVLKMAFSHLIEKKCPHYGKLIDPVKVAIYERENKKQIKEVRRK